MRYFFVLLGLLSLGAVIYFFKFENSLKKIELVNTEQRVSTSAPVTSASHLSLEHSVVNNEAPLSCNEEVMAVDKQINELKEMQDKLRASMDRNTNNAMRWQFQNENYMDARKAWDNAAKEKEQIAQIQLQIDQLEAHKQEILRQKDSPSTNG